MADLCGGEIPVGKDGISFLPTLLNQSQSSRHDYVIINNGFRRAHLSRACLITNDGWKLVEIDRTEDIFQLYYLPDDNEERSDLAGSYPGRVNDLKEILLRELDSPRPDL